MHLGTLARRLRLAGVDTDWANDLDDDWHRVSKAGVEELLPGGTRRTYQAFSGCGTCGRIYWRGAHSKRLVPIVESAIRAAAVTDRFSDQ